ncbi:MAG: hypothetical protein OJJ54_19830 [Pseudonocardia sp.]|nr:hypothetical protein [Pseudonocardia sp.]
MTEVKTDLGSRFCMTFLLKTFSPNTSPGASVAVKLAAGAVEASTHLIACRRTLFPLMCFPLGQAWMCATRGLRARFAERYEAPVAGVFPSRER